MRSFPTIPNGDCLFHSFAVNLFVAYYQGRLQNALYHPVFYKAILDLAKKSNVEIGTVPEELMKRFMEFFTFRKKVNWVKMQLTLAPALRAMVIDAIMNDKKIQSLVKNDLNNALDFSLELSTDTSIQVAEYFNGSLPIKEKIQELILNTTLINLEEKKQALREWFESEGFEQYLHGPQGIANNRVFGGELEAKVLSTLFNVRIDYYSNNNPNRNTFEGFRTARSGRKVLTFGLEFLKDHWNALFSDKDKKVAAIIDDYIPKLKRYNEMQERENKRAIQRNILQDYNSYKQHHFILFSDQTINEYCKIQGLSFNQYQRNIIAGEKRPFKSTILGRNTVDYHMYDPINYDESPIHNFSSIVEAPQFDASRYFSMFFGLAAVILFCSHCMILPLLFPFMHCAGLLTHMVSLGISLGTSFFVTERFQASNANGFIKEFSEPQTVPAQTLLFSNRVPTHDAFIKAPANHDSVSYYETNTVKLRSNP